MSNARVGKLSPSKTKLLLADAFGKECKELIVGPGPGLDAAVLDLGDGRVMAIAEDPIFPAPGLPLEMFGQFTVHIGASDVAVTGIKPQFITYSLLLPPGFSEEDTRTIVQSISDTARSLDLSIIGGHTGWYGGISMPIVGGVTVWGFAEKDKWISPGGAREGDIILMTKGPAIEATALLAVLYRERLSDRLPVATLDKLCSRTEEITVVDDALTAFAAGGVHAMHDATEGGVLGGLWEMAEACGLSVEVDLDSVAVPSDISDFADALKFDPWAAISEGTLMAAVSPDSVDRVSAALSDKGIETFALGQFVSRDTGSTIHRNDNVGSLDEPGTDPFWELFFAGLE
ncbi:MAG: AIR synthase family protein [Armatimonadota bacterium]|nr:AIR synthase family protein [bacterium]